MNARAIFAEHLREVRREMSLTQRGFSDYLDISQATLSNYENQKLVPTLETLVKIATKCNVSLDWLCGITNSKICSGKLEDMSSFLSELIRKSDSGTSFQVQITKISNNNGV